MEGNDMTLSQFNQLSGGLGGIGSGGGADAAAGAQGAGSVGNAGSKGIVDEVVDMDVDTPLDKTPVPDANNPNLANPHAVDVGKAAAEHPGNPWLNTIFITSMFVNMGAIMKALKEQKLVEGKFEVQSMAAIMSTAHEIGDFIVAKAAKEAQMHMNMAIIGFVSLGVSVAGFAVSTAGSIKAAKARAARDDANEQLAENPLKAGAAPGQVGSAKTSTPMDIDETTTTLERPDVKTKPNVQNQANRQYQSLPDAHGRAQFEDGTPVTADARTQADLSAGTGNRTQQKNEQYQKISRDGDADSANAAAAAGKDPKDLKAQKVAAEASLGKAEIMQSGGHFLSEGLARNITMIGENLIQAIAKPEIAQDERMIELARAIRDIAQRATENAAKSLTDATDVFRSLAEFLIKFADENNRAHTLTRG